MKRYIIFGVLIISLIIASIDNSFAQSNTIAKNAKVTDALIAQLKTVIEDYPSHLKNIKGALTSPDPNADILYYNTKMHFANAADAIVSENKKNKEFEFMVSFNFTSYKEAEAFTKPLTERLLKQAFSFGKLIENQATGSEDLIELKANANDIKLPAKFYGLDILIGTSGDDENPYNYEKSVWIKVLRM